MTGLWGNADSSEANRRSKRVQHDREYNINATFVMPNSFRHLKNISNKLTLISLYGTKKLPQLLGIYPNWANLWKGDAEINSVLQIE
jgi:hypothetical protein